MKKFVIIIIVSIICSRCFCKKEEKMIRLSEDIFDYYPKKDTLYVGDTLFFKITIPMILRGNDDDYNSYKICSLINTESIHLIYNLMFQRYRENRQPNESLVDIVEYSLDSKRIVKMKGKLTNNIDIPSIFERVDSSYILEFGYIFKYTGGGGKLFNKLFRSR